MLAQTVIETVSYGAALLAAFGIMLRWILGTLTTQLALILTELHKCMEAPHREHRVMIATLHEISRENTERLEVLREIRSAIGAVASQLEKPGA